MLIPNCKETLLAAAEAIAAEDGALHLTLDAVAKRAKVSKGGLLYHFPTKEALLTAMIERTCHRLDSARERARESLPPGPVQAIKAEILSRLGTHESDERGSSTMLAVMANQPELMDPFREECKARFHEQVGEGENASRYAILLFATYGIWLLELLKILPIDKAERQTILEEMLRLADACSTGCSTGASPDPSPSTSAIE